MSEHIIYRPPFEASSVLIEVTRGCSHNSCSFCTMYRGVSFGRVSSEYIDEQLGYYSEYEPDAERVFLENGDAFCLDADNLVDIARRVRESLPKVGTISMYASVRNIASKSDQDLRRIREAGINEMNIGVESGLDEALRSMNKGYDAAQALRELTRLRDAGFDYFANVIFGCAGAGNGILNAEKTAELMNRTQPALIFTGTIHAEEGCPLYEDVRSGSFTEPTVGEYLDEEERFLELLSMDDCIYFGLHPSNIAPMQGLLPEDREELINEVRMRRKRLEKVLGTRPLRGGEGAVFF
ncbi:MAG: radical SAM protein [Eubacteriaceae bacterium]|nr:radical SAM protein [Eubacteriaceae bacterium]